MFDRILIANRGEIACRIARTCRRLGIRTVAVYSDADADSLHVVMADEARRIGPAPAGESYLDIARLVAAAQDGGVAAVHPGYGFLSENADFAEACAAAGLTFIGPPAAAIRAMGSKSAAKRIMQQAGVPLVPGYHDADQEPDRLAAAADAIGYPVLIKASAGGGGKGMRMVATPGDFMRALDSAKREAAAAFGDATVLIEKYLVRSRHVEMQMFADRFGNAVHLFERDCSIQRRHQKVVEEAPAPGMTEPMRRAMGEAAVAAMQAVGYENAGTVEFIFDAERMGAPDCFYFMEMNTRLQVEHPVTELITGLDLVEWQILVAAGEPLPLTQEAIAIAGHAIEARLYAEDPVRGFLPQSGWLQRLALPADSMHVRVDSGVREGDTVTTFYDPMLAKLAVWDRDRAAAIRRLEAAIAATRVSVVRTNRDFLYAIAALPAFAAGAVHTGFIEAHAAELMPEARPADKAILAFAALAELLRRDRAASAAAAASDDPWSPWCRTDGWRLNGRSYADICLRDGERQVTVRAEALSAGRWTLDLPDGCIQVAGEVDAAGEMTADIDGIRCTASVVFDGARLHVTTRSRSHILALVDPFAAAAGDDAAGGQLVAPMPGKVLAVEVAPGDRVRRGQTLLILEAMKMEHSIAAPGDGIVSAVHAAVGDQVDEGMPLVIFEESAGGPDAEENG